MQSLNCFFYIHCTSATRRYTLSLHDALPICSADGGCRHYESTAVGEERERSDRAARSRSPPFRETARGGRRSEEHTSELQSRLHLVCRLLPEKKKIN